MGIVAKIIFCYLLISTLTILILQVFFGVFLLGLYVFNLALVCVGISLFIIIILYNYFYVKIFYKKQKQKEN